MGDCDRTERVKESEDQCGRPADDELDRMYRRLLEELNIPESKRANMLAQPMHMKWKLLSKHQRYVRVQTNLMPGRRLGSSASSLATQGRKSALTQRSSARGGPEDCVQRLDSLLLHADDVSESAIIAFRMSVISNAEWAQTFVQLGGLHKLVRLLDRVQQHRAASERLQLDLVEAVWALVQGCDFTVRVLVSEADSVPVVAMALQCSPALPRLATAVLDVLGAVAAQSDAGRQLVLGAFEVLRVEKQEELRYETLVQCLTLEHEALGLPFKASALRFVNVLLAATHTSVEDRISLRTELCYHGVLHVLADLEGVIELFEDEPDQLDGVESLSAALRDFRGQADADNAQVLASAPTTGAWLTDPEILFAKVLHQAQSSGAGPHLMQVLCALLVVPVHAELSLRVWGLVADTCRLVVSGRGGLARPTLEVIERDFLARDERFEELASHEGRVSELQFQVESHEAREIEMRKQIDELKAKASTTCAAAPPSAAVAVVISGPLAKYRKMQKTGLPRGAIQNCMTKDGVSQTDQDAFFSGGGVSDVSSLAVEPSKAQVRDDGPFAKYRKMQKTGLPRGAIQNCMTKDDVKQADQDAFFSASPIPRAEQRRPEEAEEEEEEEEAKLGEAVPLDSMYDTYIKMRSAGLPEGAIRNKMLRSGLTPEQQEVFFGPGQKKQHQQQHQQQQNHITGRVGARAKAAVPAEPAVLTLKPKPKVVPRKPMKALFWSKVDNDAVDGSLWQSLDDETVDFDMDALEGRFCQHTEEAAHDSKKAGEPGNQSSDSKGPQKKKKVELLDGKRQQNAGIAFARLKMTPAALKACILDIDLGQLGGGPDRVQMLDTLVPTAEEARAVAEYSGPTEDLGKIELLFAELGTVDHLRQRIKAWGILLRFKLQVAESQEKVQTLLRACEEIGSSSALKQTLRVILAVGNYLNGTTSRGGAYGFKLDLLAKIQNLKSSDNKSNLLEYIVREVAQKKYPVMLKLDKDLRTVQAAARISLSSLNATVKALDNDATFVKTLLAKFDGKLDADSTFVKKMGQFVVAADKSTGLLRDACVRLQGVYKLQLQTFAVTDAQLVNESSEFFALFNNFVQAFKRQVSASPT